MIWREESRRKRTAYAKDFTEMLRQRQAGPGIASSCTASDRRCFHKEFVMPTIDNLVILTAILDVTMDAVG
ncbi:MAG: hypothetical protein IJJ25_07120 [Lachnospiraceae bacterium]|nr:hypothetical protein [Lachnospiraceae bacterium]